MTIEEAAKKYAQENGCLSFNYQAPCDGTYKISTSISTFLETAFIEGAKHAREDYEDIFKLHKLVNLKLEEKLKIAVEALNKCCDRKFLRDVSLLASNPPQSSAAWDIQNILKKALTKIKGEGEIK
jgi:hypothetical protein